MEARNFEIQDGEDVHVLRRHGTGRQGRFRSGLVPRKLKADQSRIPLTGNIDIRPGNNGALAVRVMIGH